MLYGHHPQFSHADAGRMQRADIVESLPLAHSPRYSQGVKGFMGGRVRNGQDDQVRAGAISGMNGVQRMEHRLRSERVVCSEGRIVTEEENRQQNMAMLQRGVDPRTLPAAHQHQPAFNPHSYYQGAPSTPMPQDPRLMMEAQPYGYPPQEQTYAPPGYPQQPQPQIQLAQPQQSPRLLYGDGNAAMVGDLIKCEAKRGPMAEMMCEVEGATNQGIRVTVPNMGILEIPFQEMDAYVLMGRAS